MSVSQHSYLTSLIERVLTYFSLCESAIDKGAVWPEAPEYQRKWISVPLAYFNGADPAFAYPDKFRSLIDSHARSFICPQEISHRDLTEWDVSSMVMTPSGSDGLDRSIYQVKRVRRAPLKEVRGLFPLRSGVIVEYSFSTIASDGTHLPCRYYAERLGEGKWEMIGQPFEIRPGERRLEDPDISTIEASKSLAFTDFYEWRVEVGYQGFPTLGLRTDPAGAREAFRLRDLPNGATRRAALRNWVSGHYRRPICGTEYDSEAIKVIEHLRGATDFRWNGMTCKVIPSSHDLKRAETLKSKRGH